MRHFIVLPLAALTACASAAPPAPIAVAPAAAADASSVKWTRLYCTPDNQSHFESMASPLDRIDFAPPASPIFIGGGGPARKIVFGGFEQYWGAADVRSGKTHPTPVVQWITLLAGKMVISATDGETRTLNPGDIVHLEDVAPCRGHITENRAPGATFLQFVQ